MLKTIIKTILILIASYSHADSLSLGLVGITGHSASSTQNNDWNFMKRKISKNGNIVWNPEFNLTYEKNNFLLNTTYVNDCQGFNAYYIGLGYQWKISKTLKASAIAGFYNKKSRFINNYTKKSEYTYRKTYFVPWISLEKDFYMTNNLYFLINASSNYALTHVVFGMGYNF